MWDLHRALCAGLLSVLLYGSCSSARDFVHVMKTAGNEVALVHYALQGDCIVFGFRGEVSDVVARVYRAEGVVSEEMSDELLQSFTDEIPSALSRIAVPAAYQESVDAARERLSFFAVRFLQKPHVGQQVVLRGSAQDVAHQKHDFVLPFEGINTQPARLEISEVRPLYGNKRSEFVELLVVESGNLLGITITNVGGKGNRCDYHFPAAQVRVGERVVLHWRKQDPASCDELSAETVSAGSQACARARDFWGQERSIPGRNPNAIVVKESANGKIQDALLFFNTHVKKGKAPTFRWAFPEIEAASRLALEQGAWLSTHEHFPLRESHFFQCDLTPAKSIALKRKRGAGRSAADCFVLKKATMGLPNQ